MTLTGKFTRNLGEHKFLEKREKVILIKGNFYALLLFIIFLLLSFTLSFKLLSNYEANIYTHYFPHFILVREDGKMMMMIK